MAGSPSKSILSRARAAWSYYLLRVGRGMWVLRHQGLRVFGQKLRRWLAGWSWRLKAMNPRNLVWAAKRRPRKPYSYEDWIQDNEPDAQALAAQRAQSRIFAYRPKISIIVPVFFPPQGFLEEMISSVQAQTYDNWELCLANGGARDDVRRCIAESAAADDRVQFINLPENLGISGNSNRALELAHGDYAALLDQDDTLSPDALYEVVSLLQRDRDADLIYSDHDYLAADGGKRLSPLFKPDWSPELMLSANYITHLSVIRTQLVRDVGAFRPEMDGAQDWDLFFRIAQRTQRIAHLPKVLYHWRRAASSTARDVRTKPYASENQLQAITHHLESQGLSDASAFFEPSGRIRVKWTAKADKVSIIILTRGSNRLLENCIRSIQQKTLYPNYDVLIVNNGPKKAGDFPFLRDLSQAPHVRVIDYDGTFNYARLNNLATAQCDGEFLLFLNNDTEVLSEDWLEEMCMWAGWAPIGAVGAKLLRPNGSIQHAGVAVGLNGFAGHVFADCLEPADGMFGSSEWYRDYSALTSACMMVRRDVFDRLGGFNEDFLLNGSDVEFGLRANRAGLRVVYDPFVRLKHLESATHRGSIPTADFKTSFLFYGELLRSGDPYFSRNISCWSTLPALRRKDETTSLAFAEDYLEKISGASPRTGRPTASQYSEDAASTTLLYDASRAQIAASQAVHLSNPGPIEIHDVTWVIPNFTNAYYGGLYTILRFADFLAARHGVKSRFIVAGSMSGPTAQERIAEAFPRLAGTPVRTMAPDADWENTEPADAVVATLWTTAYGVLRMNRTRRKFYFLQDYEPMFYPAGSIFGQVEATYRFGFYGLANTPSIGRIYQEQYGGKAASFAPCVDTNLFYPRSTAVSAAPQNQRTLFFYGRPEHPRNSFELGAAALRIIKKRMGARLSILAAGADWNRADYGLAGVVTNLGVLSLRQTAALYRNCDAGLVLMFTKHPSYLPFELMASGALVVTNKNAATEWLLQDGQNCLLADPTPTCIAETLERGLTQDKERASIVQHAREMIVSRFADWDAQMEKLFNFMRTVE